MHRRDVLVGAGCLAAIGGGAAVAFDVVGSDGETIEPIELETIDAPGSNAGTAMVPKLGEVTFVELFATWCGVCQSMMPDLAAVHESVGDDVQFLSVTNEPLGDTVTRVDVAEWWAEHDGSWPVAADPDLELTRALDASGVPYKFVFDERNRIVWQSRGRSSADEMESRIRDAL